MADIKSFTFFASYYEALSCLKDDDKAKIIVAICDFAFNGKKPKFENPILNGFWKLILPTLSKSIARSISGQKGQGKSKTKANEKQNESKEKTNASKDKDKDKDSQVSNDTMREEKEDTIVSKKNDYQKIFDCWNEYNGKRLGRVTHFTESRKKAIKKLLDSNGITQEDLMDFFKILPYADSWLYNPNKEHQNWKPDFDWWIKNTGGWLTKALEGKVHKENPHIFLGMKGEILYAPKGHGIYYDEINKFYGFMDWYDDGDMVFDGYTDENRPNGAMLVLNNARGTIRWNKEQQKWVR